MTHYTRAYLKRTKTSLSDNLLINICMIAAAGNNAISDSDPNQYLPECVANLGTDADEVFLSNLLPSPSSFDYSKANYESFLKTRAKLIAQFAEDLCSGSVK